MTPPDSRPSAWGPVPPPDPFARGRGPSVCPHCWMVNPGPFRLCGRCGAAMDTVLQESGGLRRTAPIQSPVPVSGARLGPVARLVLGAFVLVLALGYLAQLLPTARSGAGSPAPAGAHP